MRTGECVLLALAAMLCASLPPAQGRIRNDGADELFVEYEEYELPENETLSSEQRAWEQYDMLEYYGFDIEPCLATGCTEEMLNNDKCDEQCNHALCDYDITLCFKFFDMHGCKLPSSFLLTVSLAPSLICGPLPARPPARPPPCSTPCVACLTANST